MPQGRRRDQPRYASRTLDIDIVFIHDLVLDGPGHLQLPRNELKYAFVLKPLLDLEPDLRVPGDGRSLSQLWATLTADDPAAEAIERQALDLG